MTATSSSIALSSWRPPGRASGSRRSPAPCAIPLRYGLEGGADPVPGPRCHCRNSEQRYIMTLAATEFLCKPFTPPQAPMNNETPPSSSANLTLRLLRPGELAGAGEPRLSWLWDGYLAPSKVTALISPPKTGKTTLL